MAATRLIEKLDTHPLVQSNYRKLVQRGEHFALLVWERIVRLAIHAREPGVLQHGVDLSMLDTLPGHVADCVPCSREQASAALEVLHEGLLLGVDDAELRLPVTLRPARQVSDASDKGGRPRRGENPEQARARRRQERERQQGSFKLAIVGGRTDAASAGNLTPETGNPEVRFSRGVSAVVSEAVSGLETRAETAEVSSRAVAAAAVSTTLESTISAAAAAESRLARRAVSGEVSGGVSREVSGPVSRRVSGESSPEVSEPIVSREAEQIAGRVLGIYNVKTDVVPEIAPFVQSYLDEVLSPEEIWAALSGGRQDGGQIHSVHWFKRKLDPLLERKRLLATTSGDFASRNAEVAADVPSPQVLHPAIAANPAWADQTRAVNNALSRLLHAWDLPADHQFRPGKLKLARDGAEPAWQLFVAVYPEAWEAIGEEPPAERARAASG